MIAPSKPVLHDGLDDGLAAKLMLSMAAGRLAFVVGAGLSMSLPSRVPSAKALANQLMAKYHALTGLDLPAHSVDDLTKVVNELLSTNQFHILIEKLVEWLPFRRSPNAGHEAIADLLGCHALSLGVTTNFDELVEVAAQSLGEGDFRGAIDSPEAAVSRPHAPLVKLHGCCVRDPLQTLWSPVQLEREPLKSRIASLTAWLSGQLVGKDLVVVGFWSDWPHLLDAFRACMSEYRPPFVLLVDPADADVLRDKAGDLWSWALSADDFHHVRTDGAAFLDALRVRFGSVFQEQLLKQGESLAATAFGVSAGPVGSLPSRTASELFEVRRDACGCAPGEMPRKREPSREMTLVGAAHVALLKKGASVAGATYELNQRRIRVVQGAGVSLADAKNRYLGGAFPPGAQDVVLCAGAVDFGAPGNFVQGDPASTIVRAGPEGEWVTDEYLLKI